MLQQKTQIEIQMKSIFQNTSDLLRDVKMSDLKKQKLEKCESLDMIVGIIYCLKDIPPLNLNYIDNNQDLKNINEYVTFKIMESFSAFNATVMNYYNLIKYVKDDTFLKQAERIYKIYENPHLNTSFVQSFKPVEAFLYSLFKDMIQYYRLQKQYNLLG
ncbi:hypothetical protein ABPG73_016083 [Tetrahymena malaccensis]